MSDPICGEPLKTRACSRAALWPGGKCKRHGFGANTFEEARAIAAKLRKAGLGATAADGCVVLELADAESLLARLGE